MMNLMHYTALTEPNGANFHGGQKRSNGTRSQDVLSLISSDHASHVTVTSSPAICFRSYP